MSKRRGHGEGSIFPVKDAEGNVIRWAASVNLGIVNGKRKRKTIYAKTRAEVQKKLKDLFRQQDQGTDLSVERIRLETYINLWLETVIKPHRQARTLQSYRSTARLSIIPHLGHYLLDKLTPIIIQRWINTLAAGSETTRKVQYARSVLSRALNRAVKWGYIVRNPVASTDTPRTKKRPIEPLTSEQAQNLIKAVEGHRLEATIHIALFLGLRRGEVLGLLWRNVDFANSTLEITGSLQRVDGELVRDEPKTENSKRILPIPGQLMKALLAHKASLDHERYVRSDEWEEHGYIFPSGVGTPLEPTTLQKFFKAALAKAGLPTTIRFHDLRHSCATFLIAEGVHPRVVMEILGHSKFSLTMELYGHVSTDTQREGIEKLEALLKKKADSEE